MGSLLVVTHRHGVSWRRGAAGVVGGGTRVVAAWLAGGRAGAGVAEGGDGLAAAGAPPLVLAAGAAEPLPGGGGGPGEAGAAGGAGPLRGGHGRAPGVAVAVRRVSARCWWARIR